MRFSSFSWCDFLVQRDQYNEREKHTSLRVQWFFLACILFQYKVQAISAWISLLNSIFSIFFSICLWICWFCSTIIIGSFVMESHFFLKNGFIRIWLFFPSSCRMCLFREFWDKNQIESTPISFVTFYLSMCAMFFAAAFFCCQIFSVWAAPAINKGNTMKRTNTHLQNLYETNQIQDKVNFVSDSVHKSQRSMHQKRTNKHTSVLIYNCFIFFLDGVLLCVFCSCVFLLYFWWISTALWPVFLFVIFLKEDLTNTNVFINKWSL